MDYLLVLQSAREKELKLELNNLTKELDELNRQWKNDDLYMHNLFKLNNDVDLLKEEIRNMTGLIKSNQERYNDIMNKRID